MGLEQQRPGVMRVAPALTLPDAVPLLGEGVRREPRTLSCNMTPSHQVASEGTPGQPSPFISLPSRCGQTKVPAAAPRKNSPRLDNKGHPGLQPPDLPWAGARVHPGRGAGRSMHWDIFAAIIVTATIQSLFGVGVLLFGTPILLVLGYKFVTTLTILLPISLTINLVQVSKHYRFIDASFYKNILLLSIPCVVVSLLLVTRSKINIGVLVGLFLILVALKHVYSPLNRLIESLVRYERLYFSVMGIIHGLTNLGGSLLTAIIHSKHYEKDVTRATTAVSYGTFALFQLFTLLVSLKSFTIPLLETALFMGIGVSMFALTERLVYARISPARYRAIFAVFLFLSGAVLIAKTALAH